MQAHSVNSVQANINMWYVYILLCDNELFYVGLTNDLEQRAKSHKNGESFFTKKFSDVKLVYHEEYPSKSVAAKREKQIKGWNHEKKSKLIRGEL